MSARKVDPGFIDYERASVKLRALAKELAPNCDVVLVFFDARTEDCAVLSTGFDGRICGDQGRAARVAILRAGIAVEYEPDYSETVRTQ